MRPSGTRVSAHAFTHRGGGGVEDVSDAPRLPQPASVLCVAALNLLTAPFVPAARKHSDGPGFSVTTADKVAGTLRPRGGGTAADCALPSCFPTFLVVPAPRSSLLSPLRLEPSPGF